MPTLIAELAPGDEPAVYGAVTGILGPVSDVDKVTENIRAQAVEVLERWGLRALGPIEVMRQPGMSEADWAAAGMKAPWQPRLERWGWKVLAERAPA